MTAKSNVKSKAKMFENLGAPLRQKVVPARSQVAVNKSLSKIASARKGTPATSQPKDDGMLETVFAENFDMAIALLPTVPFTSSKTVRKWIAALVDPAGNTPLSKRNAYLSFMIFQMQNMKIVEPFDKEPPQNLEATKLYNAAKMKSMIDEMDRKNRRNALREGLTYSLASFRTDFKTPPEFFNDQIFPNNGIVCYGGCFSNHFQ